jgi:hypothetical protein
MIGRIEYLPLREVWKHEEADFSKWLGENIDILSECIGLPLDNPKREQAVGTFSADLVCISAGGKLVVIENQLTKSDHDHLGKLLTYMSNRDASAGIWIVSECRPEHVRAVSWMNQSPNADFYIVKVEAIRIGDSEPAPLLTMIVGPGEAGKAAGKAEGELKELDVLRRDFWTKLLDIARTKTELHSNRNPTTDGYISAGAGKAGIQFNYCIWEHKGRVELYIDCGPGSEQRNIDILELLLTHRADIEKAFGQELEWDSMPGRRAARVLTQTVGGYRNSKSEWTQIITHMVDAMVRLEQALKPYIRKLQ